MIDRDQLAVDNLGLIHHVITRLPAFFDGDYEDDWQDGTIGLLRAAALHNPDQGEFSTIACYWIRWAIQQGRAGRAGANYRAARTRNLFYESPVSIDDSLTVNGEQLPTLADRLIDPTPPMLTTTIPASSSSTNWSPASPTGNASPSSNEHPTPPPSSVSNDRRSCG